jgi:hypothetical protein
MNSKNMGVIIISDLSGKELKIMSFNGNSIEVDSSELIPGTYFINLKISGENHILKFTKI